MLLQYMTLMHSLPYVLVEILIFLVDILLPEGKKIDLVSASHLLFEKFINRWN